MNYYISNIEDLNSYKANRAKSNNVKIIDYNYIDDCIENSCLLPLSSQYLFDESLFFSFIKINLEKNVKK